MKKYIVICVSCFLLVSFSACGKTQKVDDKDTVMKTETSKAVEEQEEK